MKCKDGASERVVEIKGEFPGGKLKTYLYGDHAEDVISVPRKDGRSDVLMIAEKRPLTMAERHILRGLPTY